MPWWKKYFVKTLVYLYLVVLIMSCQVSRILEDLAAASSDMRLFMDSGLRSKADVCGQLRGSDISWVMFSLFLLLGLHHIISSCNEWIIQKRDAQLLLRFISPERVLPCIAVQGTGWYGRAGRWEVRWHYSAMIILDQSYSSFPRMLYGQAESESNDIMAKCVERLEWEWLALNKLLGKLKQFHRLKIIKRQESTMLGIAFRTFSKCRRLLHGQECEARSMLRRWLFGKFARYWTNTYRWGIRTKYFQKDHTNVTSLLGSNGFRGDHTCSRCMYALHHGQRRQAEVLS